jgi:hypothetical protein
MANPLLGGISTASQIVTPMRSPQFTRTCATVVDTPPTVITTATAPASNFEEGRIVWNSEGFSLMKLIPVASRDSVVSPVNTISGLKMRVIGWSTDESTSAAGNPTNRFHWPTVLVECALTRGTTGWTPWNNVTQNNYAWASMELIVKTAGDAKIHNANGITTGGAFLVVDTMGCQYIDVRFWATSVSGDPVANVLWQSL